MTAVLAIVIAAEIVFAGPWLLRLGERIGWWLATGEWPRG